MDDSANTSGTGGAQGPSPTSPATVRPSSMDAAMRRYAAKVAIRWSPLLACTAALALIVALAPAASAPAGLAAGSGPQGASPSKGTSSRLALGRRHLGGTTGSTTGTTSGYSSPAASAGLSGSQAGGSPSGGSAPGNAVAATRGASGSSGASRVAVSGVKCGPGVRQFAWSAYAPMCVPAFHGSNGGATSHGVTASTITFSYALPNSSQQAAVNALTGSANVNDPAYVQDLQTLIRFFNTQYELYGRHVVLKTFQAQGDYLLEDQGQGLQGAQADAATAYSLGAFGDMTFPLYASQPYWQDLAAQGVLGFGAPYLPQSWFAHYAPFEYSVFTPTGANAARAAGNMICRRMAGMPAIFSPQFGSTTRKFGLITPDNPVYMQVGNDIQANLAACGVALAERESYTIDVPAMESQATAMVAKMKAQGVTTVICACDPIIPIFISRAADQQDYYPEWITNYWGDPDTRNFSQDQWDHALSNGPQFPPLKTTESYKAFELADPGHPPAEQYFYVAYEELLQIFGALQAAGPDLTPRSFEAGMFSLPPSEGNGQFGTWTYGQGVFDPIATGPITWWNPSATSAFDNKPGAWLYCNGGTWFAFDNPSSYGGPHQQLQCFGK